MKTIKLLAIPAFALLVITGCKSKKAVSVAKQEGLIEISTPFDSKEYRSDEEHFRSKQSGKSPDLATAKKIAYQNARAEMASNINAIVKRVTDQYTNQRNVGNTQEFENKFEELSREVVNLEMSNVKELGQKTFQDPSDKAYIVWIALEANKKSVFDKIDAKISNDGKLKLDYDKQKFQQVFDAEMKKMAEEGR
jgi:rubrerythrin